MADRQRELKGLRLRIRGAEWADIATELEYEDGSAAQAAVERVVAEEMAKWPTHTN